MKISKYNSMLIRKSREVRGTRPRFGRRAQVWQANVGVARWHTTKFIRRVILGTIKAFKSKILFSAFSVELCNTQKWLFHSSLRNFSAKQLCYITQPCPTRYHSAKIALLEKKGSYFIHSAQDEVVGDPVFAHLVSWVFGNYPQKGEDYHKLVPILQVSAAT